MSSNETWWPGSFLKDRRDQVKLFRSVYDSLCFYVAKCCAERTGHRSGDSVFWISCGIEVFPALGTMALLRTMCTRTRTYALALSLSVPLSLARSFPGPYLAVASWTHTPLNFAPIARAGHSKQGA